MPWEPDEKFWDDLKEMAKARSIREGLEQYLDDAYQDTYIYVSKHTNTKEKLAGMPRQEQLQYLVKAIRNRALKIVKPPRIEPPRPDGNKPIIDWKLTCKVAPKLNQREQFFLLFELYGYSQKQIAEIMGWSPPTCSRIGQSVRKKIREGIIMSKDKYSGSAITDDIIHDFIDGKQNAKGLGNDNLHRRIEQIMKPLREGLLSVLGGQPRPPIPPGMRKNIIKLIQAHSEPKTIGEVLEEAAQKQAALPGLCMDLLDAARRLNQPYRWISPDESLRAIENRGHAKFVTEQLTKVFAASLQIFISVRNGTTRSSISNILCDKLKNWVDRFGLRQGQGSSPFEPLPCRTLPLHEGAASMDEDAEESLQQYTKDFNKTCTAMKKKGDTKNNFKDMQSIVDYAVRLLEWKRYDAPRYLAPALVEEAIEVVLAINGPVVKKSDIFREMGDLLGMALWFSNVLGIPNIGHDIIGSYQKVEEDKK